MAYDGSEDKTRTNITIPKDLKARLEEIVKKNRSFNNLVITVLQKFADDTPE